MTTTPRTHLKTWTRRVLGTTLTLILTAATLAGVILAGVVVSSRSIHQPVPADSADVPASSLTHTEAGGPKNPTVTRQGRRLVVAFVAGTNGTIASDLLAPYDIFASSPAFTAYVAADVATAVPLEGGPALVPTYTFADVDADPALRPDLVVVPGLSEPEGAAEAALRGWVTSQHDHGSRVLGVCSGALVLAATGMLDGLDATSHWSRISALEASRPAVHWERGRVYVEDGSVTTTAAVSSGVPAALHLVAELAGRDEAQRVANLHPELNWTPTKSTTIPEDHFAARDWPVGLNYVMPWLRPRIGIALGDGVGELDATAAFEVYGQSAAAAPSPWPRATPSGRATASSCSPPATRTHPACPVSSYPAQAHLRRSTPDCVPGPPTSDSPSNHSRLAQVGTDLAAAGSPQPCRTLPSTPTPPRLRRPPR